MARTEVPVFTDNQGQATKTPKTAFKKTPSVTEIWTMCSQRTGKAATKTWNCLQEDLPGGGGLDDVPTEDEEVGRGLGRGKHGTVHL